jgi:hypothetical protein
VTVDVVSLALQQRPVVHAVTVSGPRSGLTRRGTDVVADLLPFRRPEYRPISNERADHPSADRGA